MPPFPKRGFRLNTLPVKAPFRHSLAGARRDVDRRVHRISDGGPPAPKSNGQQRTASTDVLSPVFRTGRCKSELCSRHGRRGRSLHHPDHDHGGCDHALQTGARRCRGQLSRHSRPDHHVPVFADQARGLRCQWSRPLGVLPCCAIATHPNNKPVVTMSDRIDFIPEGSFFKQLFRRGIQKADGSWRLRNQRLPASCVPVANGLAWLFEINEPAANRRDTAGISGRNYVMICDPTMVSSSFV
jgi:hypothetical protein